MGRSGPRAKGKNCKYIQHAGRLHVKRDARKSGLPRPSTGFYGVSWQTMQPGSRPLCPIDVHLCPYQVQQMRHGAAAR